MEDQMVFTGNRRGISRRQWSIKYSIKGDYRNVCLFSPIRPPLPDLFPSFRLPSLPWEPGHTACDFFTALIYCIGRMKKTCIES